MARTYVYATVREILEALKKWAVAQDAERRAADLPPMVSRLKSLTCAILDRPGPFDLSESINIGELTPFGGLLVCQIHGVVPEEVTRQVNVGGMPGMIRIHRGCQFQVIAL